jgi:hypothetical protein
MAAAWREWLYGKLTGTPALTALVPTSAVLSAGAMPGGVPSARPFIVFRFVDDVPQLRDGQEVVARNQLAQVWIYDNPGSYDRIDEILAVVEDALVGPVAIPSAVACESGGYSGELQDDDYKALTRYGLFTLVGATS